MTQGQIDLEKPRLLNISLDLIEKGEALKKKYYQEMKTKKRSAKTMREIDEFEEKVQDYIYVFFIFSYISKRKQKNLTKAAKFRK